MFFFIVMKRGPSGWTTFFLQVTRILNMTSCLLQRYWPTQQVSGQGSRCLDEQVGCSQFDKKICKWAWTTKWPLASGCSQFDNFLQTRSCAALRAADLDWIVGPEYSLGAGINKNVTDTFHHTRGVTTDLGGGQGRNKQKRYRHFSSLTRGHNWPFRCLDDEIFH